MDFPTSRMKSILLGKRQLRLHIMQQMKYKLLMKLLANAAFEQECHRGSFFGHLEL